MSTRLKSLSLILAFVSGSAFGNECSAPKPVKISGALCGRVFNLIGEIIPNEKLQVLDASRGVVSEAQTDSRGDFIITHLEKGNYRLTTTAHGYLLAYAAFEIRKSQAMKCTRPVSVYLATSCCCWGDGISKNRPSHY
jgi:Carboxypeptidase regulatory-like domain